MTLSKDYFINTEKDGRLTGNTTPQDIDRIFALLRERDRILIHVHGGLVTEKSGMKSADDIHDEYLDAGAHPVFFIWESDIVSVVTRNFVEIAGEDLFKILLKFLLKKAAARIGGIVPEGAVVTEDEVKRELAGLELGREPFAHLVPLRPVPPLTAAEEDAAARELAGDPDFRGTLNGIARGALVPETPVVDGMRVRASLRTLASPEIVEEIVQDSRGITPESPLGIPAAAIRAGKILFRIIMRYAKHRDHGLHATVVEEILREFYVANVGSKVWKAMKGETSDTFDADGRGVPRGGRYFVDNLVRLLEQTPEEKWPRLTLVGHSAGAIFVNNLLLDVRRRREAGDFPAAFRFENVLFEAPACTFTQCAEMLRQCSDLFRHFRMFALSDKRERQDELVRGFSVFYPSSLLYFVSGVTELSVKDTPEADIPLVGMQRYHDMADVYTDADVVLVRRFIAADPDRSVYAPDDRGDGLRSNASHHGDADNDPDTLRSVQHIVRVGIVPKQVPLLAGIVTESPVDFEATSRAAALARIYRAFGVPAGAAMSTLSGLTLESPEWPTAGDLPADGESPVLTLPVLDAMEARLAADPEGTLDRFRDSWRQDLTEDELRAALARAREILTHPERHAGPLEAQLVLESAPPPLPDGFTFPGMDLEKIEINYESHQYETIGDLTRWIFVSGPPSLFRPKSAPFRDPAALTQGAQYSIRSATADQPVTVALLADFGTGLYHARYIAKQLRTNPCEYTIHLGDVYYNGTQKEFDEHMVGPLTPVLSRTEFFTLNSNHEMLSGGVPYFRFLDWKRQQFPHHRQEGSLFALSNGQVQIVAIDTDYEEFHRFPAKMPHSWLQQRLAEGRQAGKINILLSADQPYEYGKNELTKLWREDIKPLVGNDIDVWFWGNTHYCALFDRTSETPFVGSCIGHAGYPYGTLRTGKAQPAPVRFLETTTRFEGYKIRKDMGNNGWVRMTIHTDGTLALQYLDWRSNVRCDAQIVRDASGRVTLRRPTVHPLP